MILSREQSASSSITCYTHLNCTRNYISWCLDWREICDGKVDCWPIPVDEQNCEILEENECESNEYRCFNGQCIPETFLLDYQYSPDCLDRTDEDLLGHAQYPDDCRKRDPSFRCTDTTYSHWTSHASYSTGQLFSTTSYNEHFKKFEISLLSYQANTHITEKCWAIMICLVQTTRQIYFVSIYAMSEKSFSIFKIYYLENYKR